MLDPQLILLSIALQCISVISIHWLCAILCLIEGANVWLIGLCFVLGGACGTDYALLRLVELELISAVTAAVNAQNLGGLPSDLLQLPFIATIVYDFDLR